MIHDLHVEDLEKKHYYGLALSVNVRYAGFRLTLPFAPLGLPVIDFVLQCSSEISDPLTASLFCHLKADTDKFIKVVLQKVEEVAMWVFQEVDKTGKKVIQTLAASIDRAGIKAGELFSPENVKKTYSEILSHDYDLGNLKEDFEELAAIGYELLSFCEVDGEKWGDATMCAGDPLNCKAKIRTCCNCLNDDTLWRGNIQIASTRKCVPGGHACGVEPKWGDGTLCKIPGIIDNCSQCKNTASYWYAVKHATIPGTAKKIPPGPGTACGFEPCWNDGNGCVAIGPINSCERCCSGKHMATRCGKQGCWNDGTRCVGDSCQDCCKSASWWHGYGVPGEKRGKEPCWGDGTACVGITCGSCCNGSSLWKGAPKGEKVKVGGQRCGKEPCWGSGTKCVPHISCDVCCHGWNFWGTCKDK